MPYLSAGVPAGPRHLAVGSLPIQPTHLGVRAPEIVEYEERQHLAERPVPVLIVRPGWNIHAQPGKRAGKGRQVVVHLVPERVQGTTLPTDNTLRELDIRVVRLQAPEQHLGVPEEKRNRDLLRGHHVGQVRRRALEKPLVVTDARKVGPREIERLDPAVRRLHQALHGARPRLEVGAADGLGPVPEVAGPQRLVQGAVAGLADLRLLDLRPVAREVDHPGRPRLRAGDQKLDRLPEGVGRIWIRRPGEHEPPVRAPGDDPRMRGGDELRPQALRVIDKHEALLVQRRKRRDERFGRCRFVFLQELPETGQTADLIARTRPLEPREIVEHARGESRQRIAVESQFLQHVERVEEAGREGREVVVVEEQ